MDSLRDIFINHIFPETLRVNQEYYSTRTELSLVSRTFSQWVKEIPNTEKFNDFIHLSDLERHYNIVFKRGIYNRGPGMAIFYGEYNLIHVSREALEGRDWQVNGYIDEITEQPDGLWIRLSPRVPGNSLQEQPRLFPWDDYTIYICYRRFHANIMEPPHENRNGELNPTMERTPEEKGAIFVPYRREHNPGVLHRSGESKVIVYKVSIYPNQRFVFRDGTWFKNKRTDGFYGL